MGRSSVFLGHVSLSRFFRVLADDDLCSETLHACQHVDTASYLIHFLYLLGDFLAVLSSHPATIATAEANIIESGGCCAHLVLNVALD